MEQSILTKEQRAFLDELGKNEYLQKRFYLTGGTALSEYYLHHRLSEDLDFFSPDSPLPFEEIDVFIRGFAALTGATVEAQLIHDRRRFFFRWNEKPILKVEFVLYQFPSLSPAQNVDGIRVDAFEDIAANKIMAMTQRREVKDFVDLYFMMTEKQYTIYTLLELARKKFTYHFEPIWIGSELAGVRTFSFLPEMLKPLDLETLKKFFQEESRRLKPSIFDDL